MKQYIVAYDITCQKRASKVRRLVYSYSLSGQKSALEVFLDRKSLNELIKHLKPILKKEDSVNIIEVFDDIMVFGKTNFLDYNNGVILI